MPIVDVPIDQALLSDIGKIEVPAFIAGHPVFASTRPIVHPNDTINSNCSGGSNTSCWNGGCEGSANKKCFNKACVQPQAVTRLPQVS